MISIKYANARRIILNVVDVKDFSMKLRPYWIIPTAEELNLTILKD